MRKALNVHAFPAVADLVKREADFKATVTLAETGDPIKGPEIHFRTAKSAIELFAVFTNPEGTAENSHGSLRDPATVLDALTQGITLFLTETLNSNQRKVMRL